MAKQTVSFLDSGYRSQAIVFGLLCVTQYTLAEFDNSLSKFLSDRGSISNADPREIERYRQGMLEKGVPDWVVDKTVEGRSDELRLSRGLRPGRP